MDYSSYQIEDFLTDDSFIAYCYNDDNAAVTKWENILAENPALAPKMSEARELCLLLAIKVSPAEKAIALERLKQAITAVGDVEPESRIISIRNYFTKWVAIAASLLIMAGAFAVYKINNTNPSGAALYSAATDANYKLIGKTDFGHRKLIKLPDGSLALLNGSSTLKIAKDYNENNRHLLLSGEAFFSVTKDKHKPFVVITGKTATTALGTSFKVESYNNAQVASVMLSTGKVKVECTQPDLKVEDVMLIPGQKAALYNGDKAFTQTTFYAKDLQNWIDRKLVFKGADLKEIAAKLKTVYGVIIVPKDKTGDEVSFTGEFIGKDLTEVLDAIGFTNHFTYKQSGSTVQLQF
ncbi:FecR family protein [Mucilaginibacter dorajii]|uniref:FecR family protein n=1 Tax=Mucilaginibacter dorajii TaxID=692994 RepID=A0ABP7PNW0_9SPHI|nr:FecR domain-containing protein [Mucilaginibacter dorajii]MCS3736365.1 ferric-dicitrate binding protein FerR (iron transport regulator) [Mucilaginibacter dorajii]